MKDQQRQDGLTSSPHSRPAAAKRRSGQAGSLASGGIHQRRSLVSSLVSTNRTRELVASPELARACLTSLDSRQARRAVTLLARASADDPEAETLLSQTLPDVAGFIIGLDAPRETLTAIFNAIPTRP